MHHSEIMRAPNAASKDAPALRKEDAARLIAAWRDIIQPRLTDKPKTPTVEIDPALASQISPATLMLRDAPEARHPICSLIDALSKSGWKIRGSKLDPPVYPALASHQMWRPLLLANQIWRPLGAEPDRMSAESNPPTDPLDARIDGVPLRSLIDLDQRRRRENVRWIEPMTSDQRAAVSAHWSAQLRDRIREAATRERNRVTYCEDP